MNTPAASPAAPLPMAARRAIHWFAKNRQTTERRERGA
jgi:hypothetical protein